MVGTLTVQNLQGPTSGANPNKVIIPSGQTLDASNGFVAPAGHIVQTVSNSRDFGLTFSNLTTSNTVSATDILACAITPKFANSQIMITTYVQWSVDGSGGDDWGMVLQRGSTTILGEGYMGYWISGGGVDNASSIANSANINNPRYYVRTATKSDIDKARPSGTSEVSYYIRHKAGQAINGQTIYYGRDGWGGASGYESQRSKMTMILQEIAQ
jgi:hypothetical protein